MCLKSRMDTNAAPHPGRCYRDLVVWQQAIELVTEVYRNTDSFPDRERFGLTSQIRRAAVSVPSNVAEGQGRLTKGEFKQFLGHARGSLLETETQLLMAGRLCYLSQKQIGDLLNLTAELGRVLNGLIASI